MQNYGYSIYIREKVNTFGCNIPILNSDIANSMAERFSLELPYAQRVVNQNMKRLAEQNIVIHFAKGVYYKPAVTPFGKSVMNRTDYYYKTLTCPNSEQIGYEGCPSVLNTIGLCTVMTAKRTIVTNLYRKAVPKGIGLIIQKPKAKINDQNYRYFQLADILCGMKTYFVDAQDPKAVINNYIKQFCIDPLRLIAYARKFYTQSESEYITAYLTEGLI